MGNTFLERLRAKGQELDRLSKAVGETLGWRFSVVEREIAINPDGEEDDLPAYSADFTAAFGIIEHAKQTHPDWTFYMDFNRTTNEHELGWVGDHTNDALMAQVGFEGLTVRAATDTLINIPAAICRAYLMLPQRV